MRLIDPKKPTNRLYVSDFVMEQMQKIPTIEAKPVKHGRWMNCFEQDGEKAGYCSECHAIRFVDPYCPNCGAEMDGGADHERS